MWQVSDFIAPQGIVFASWFPNDELTNDAGTGLLDEWLKSAELSDPDNLEAQKLNVYCLATTYRTGLLEQSVGVTDPLYLEAKEDRDCNCAAYAAARLNNPYAAPVLDGNVFKPHFKSYAFSYPDAWDASGAVTNTATFEAVLTTPDNEELQRVLPTEEIGRAGAQYYLGTVDELPPNMNEGNTYTVSIEGVEGKFLVRYIYTDPFNNMTISSLLGRQFIGSFSSGL